MHHLVVVLFGFTWLDFAILRGFDGIEPIFAMFGQHFGHFRRLLEYILVDFLPCWHFRSIFGRFGGTLVRFRANFWVKKLR